jgi:hypothetical protein
MPHRKGLIIASRISVPRTSAPIAFDFLQIPSIKRCSMARSCKGPLRGNPVSHLVYSVQILAVARREPTYVLSVTLWGSRKEAPLSNDLDNRAYRDPQATHRLRFPLIVSSVSVIDGEEERTRTRLSSNVDVRYVPPNVATRS